MKKYRTAYQAAKAHAKRHDEVEEFKKDCNEYTDRLFSEDKIREYPSYKIGGVKWILQDGSGWYIFDQGGKVVNGPYEQKKLALSSINEDSSEYIDTGIYKAKDSGFYVARKNTFESHSDVP